MAKLLTWIVDHPYHTLVILFLASALFMSRITTLEFDSSAEGLMAEHDPARDYYEQTKKTFGDDNLTVVMIKSKDVFTPEILQLVRELTDALTVLDGVTRVESLVTVNRIKGEGEFLNTDPLVESIPGPGDTKEIERIRSDALGNYIFLNNIVSKDATTTAINVSNESRSNDPGFNARLSSQIEEIIKKSKKGDFEIYQIGYPLTKVTFSQYIQNDMRNFVPLAGLVLLISLYLSFRSPVGIFVPLTTALLSIGWTLGFMVWMGYPVNVITATVPAILIAVGSTEDCHIIAEYIQHLREGQPKNGALHHAMQAVALPIILTSSTTVLGFGSIAINDITILKQFGIVSAFGLTANFFITIMVVPTVLNFLPAPRRLAQMKEEQGKADFMERLLQKVGYAILHKKRLLAITAIIVTVISFIGIFRIKLNNDFISFFKKGSFIRVRTDDAHNRMAGMLNFYTTIETHRENGLKEPAVMKQVAKLQSFINGIEGIDKTISLPDYVQVMNREMNNGDKKFESVPDNEQLIAQYILLMDQAQVSKYASYNFATANISVRHNISSSWELNRVLEEIQKYAADNMTKDLAVKFTGEGILINSAADSMASGQVYSLSIALSAIFIIMVVLFTSFKAGVLSLFPNIVPIIINFGIMGWFDIPLNAGTCMVAAISLGIAVDDTLHLMVRYNREMKVSGEQSDRVLSTVLQGEGRPVLYTSVALFFGFGILIFSNFMPNIHFGYLSAFVMVYAVLADLFLTPLLLATTQLITLWDVIGTKLSKDITRVSPLFQGLTNMQARKVISLGGLTGFKAGEPIVRQGEVGEEMYVILNGQARVTVDTPQGRRDLQVLKQGDIFGEMALLQKMARSANVTAIEDTELLKLDNRGLERISRRLPRIATKIYANISRILSERLRQQNIQLSQTA